MKWDFDSYNDDKSLSALSKRDNPQAKQFA